MGMREPMVNVDHTFLCSALCLEDPCWTLSYVHDIETLVTLILRNWWYCCIPSFHWGGGMRVCVWLSVLTRALTSFSLSLPPPSSNPLFFTCIFFSSYPAPRHLFIPPHSCLIISIYPSPPAPYPSLWLSLPVSSSPSPSSPAYRCSPSVWPRPVHSEHQIRFTGRRDSSPPAAEQRASHPDRLPWKRRDPARPHLSHTGRPVHLATPRPAHATDVQPQPQLPRTHRHAAHPRARPRAQPQPRAPGTGGSPPLPHPGGGAVAARYASLRQPHGAQPRHAGRVLQPGQPGLPPWGLGQRFGEAQLRLTMGCKTPSYLLYP